MADYKKMYQKMFEAAEMSIGILIKAQRECEEMYMDSREGEDLPLGWGPDEDGDAEGRPSAD